MPNSEYPRATLDNPFPVMLWRYFTGAHFDGRKYSNATWLKPGTLPKSQLTWWTKLPRLHRAIIRFLILAIPAAWTFGYSSSYRYWVVLCTGMIMPYGIHRGWQMVARRGITGIKVRGEYAGLGDEQNVIETLVFPDTRKDAK